MANLMNPLPVQALLVSRIKKLGRGTRSVTISLIKSTNTFVPFSTV
jgi:hypothetical protein